MSMRRERGEKEQSVREKGVKEPYRKTGRRVERKTGKLMTGDNKRETKGNDR